MIHLHMQRVATVLVALAAAGVPVPARAESSPVAQFRVRLDSARSTRAKDLVALARWCARESLPEWSARFAGRALLVDADCTAAKTLLGQTREGDAWTWPEQEHDRFRADAYRVAREPPDLMKKRRQKDDLGAHRFARIAADASDVAADAATAPDDRALLDALAREAWQLAIDAEPSCREAQEALGYVRYGPLSVPADAVPFFEARARRQAAASAALGRPVDVKYESKPNRMAGSTTERLTVYGPYDEAILNSVARRTVQARHLLCDMFGTESLAFRPKTAAIASSKLGFAALLRHYTDWDEEEIARQVERWGSTWARSDVLVMKSSGAEHSVEVLMTLSVRIGVTARRRAQAKAQGVKLGRSETWLWDAISMDVVIRMLGKFDLNVASDDGTGGPRDLSLSESWLGRARRQVEFGDDPEIGGILQREMNALRTDETAKGYAFVQYLLERDEAQAMRFLDFALVHGTPAAAREVYTATIEELEEGYRRWALLTIRPDA